MDELRKILTQIEAWANKLNLPKYLSRLPGEFLEDATTAMAETSQLVASGVIGATDAKLVLKSKIRHKWLATYNDAWSRADWPFRVFVRPFLEPILMKEFRKLWDNI